MSTIHFKQTTILLPERFVAGLTDFGPDHSKVFSQARAPAARSELAHERA